MMALKYDLRTPLTSIFEGQMGFVRDLIQPIKCYWRNFRCSTFDGITTNMTSFMDIRVDDLSSPEVIALSKGHRVPRFANIAKVARRKLRQLEISSRLDDLRAPPGNRLEALKGNRSGQHSIRINDQWRNNLTFNQIIVYPVYPGEIISNYLEFSRKFNH